ncbi:AarF/UbiB family protein [Haliscomenobacter sp.]|uniref:ABC1 kinase family protein n=1 Tax=Haliscomenobacter sp. TaxID=2717303 RepID=UPI003364BCB5
MTGSRRFRKAYHVAALVMLSYIFLMLGKRIFGQRYYDLRIEKLHVRNAERVKRAILKLNGLFIKIGQMLSILSNFLPETFQKPLEELQDKIPARPYAEVRERIIQELGKAPEELFTRFDQEPLAAASIGQAHRAQLKDGTEVVVKVQHMGIESTARIDLEIIRRLIQVSAWFYSVKGMDYVYTQVKLMIEEELDFVKEAAAMVKIRVNLQAEPGLSIPEIHPQYSATRVMTTTWYDGVKISNLEQIDAWGLDRRALASTLLRSYSKMVLKDGFYHADPHPGNILVQSNGTVVLLDFGATGQLSPALREGIPKMIESAVKNDTQGIIEAVRLMGFLAEGREAEQIAEKMIGAMRNFLQNEVKLDGLNFKDIQVNPFNNSMVSLIQEIGISGIAGTVLVPKDWVLLNRALTLLLGLCNSLDPTLNPLEVVRPYAQELVQNQQGGWLGFVRNLVQGTLVTTLALPDELKQTLQKARKGQLEVRTPDIREGARLLYLAARQWLMALLGLAAIVLAQWFSRIGEERSMQFAYAAALLFGWLFFKALRRGAKLFNSISNIQ